MSANSPQQLPSAEQATGSRLGYAIVSIFQIGVGAAGLSALLSGIGILGWQIVTFLDTAIWNPFGIDKLLAFLGSDWAANPDRALGIHWLISWIPTSLILGGIGGALLIWVQQEIAEEVSERRRQAGL